MLAAAGRFAGWLLDITTAPAAARLLAGAPAGVWWRLYRSRVAAGDATVIGGRCDHRFHGGT